MWQEIKHIQDFLHLTRITIPSAELALMVVNTEREKLLDHPHGSTWVADGLVHSLQGLENLIHFLDYYLRFGSKEHQEGSS